MSRKLEPDVGRLAVLICIAARHAALDAIDTTLSVAEEQTAESADRMRAIAGQALAHAAIMQHELACFAAAVRPRCRP